MVAVAEQYATQSDTITIAEIIPAPAANRSAAVKDTSGIRYGIWPNKLDQVKVGYVYDIDFSSKVVNGATFRDIKGIRFNSDATAKAQQVIASNNNRAQPVRTPSGPAAAAPGAGQGGGTAAGGGGFYRPTSPRDAERMFVCSTLNAYIQTGRVDANPDTLINYVNTLRDVWHATFGQDAAA